MKDELYRGISDEDIKSKYHHPDSGKCFWCIVTYVGQCPFYYYGYFGRDIENDGSVLIKPAIGSDFHQAMKLHDKKEAERILSKLNVKDWKVEEHGYF